MREIIGRYKFSPAQLRLMVKFGIALVDTIEKAHSPAYKFTVGEFVRMAETGILDSDARVELMDGVIIEMAPTGRPHGRRTHRIARMFGRVVPEDVEISVQSTIRLNDWTGPEPDIALLNPQASLDEENIPRAEDVLLIVEVADSTLRIDRGDKARRYAESGILELWIFVLADGEIEVCRQPAAEGYADVRRFRRGDMLAPLRLPEIRLAVDELLA